MNSVAAPQWSDEEFEEQLAVAAAAFRAERIREPTERYLEVIDDYAARTRTLLEVTDNLARLTAASQQASAQGLTPAAQRLVTTIFEEIWSDEIGLEALRYLAGPPISADDLKTLAEASLTKGRVLHDPEMATRLLNVVLARLDGKRFPWVAEQRRPDNLELRAAILASASLLATQRVQTDRRSLAKTRQEKEVAGYLASIGLIEVGPRKIRTSDDAPGRGSFCGECLFGDRKADLVVQLHDGRLMPIECKVSNSATNSVKRLNNDAAVKAEAWIKQFGTLQTVPTAVLSGVFKKHNLLQAQKAGLTIFWAHDLSPLGDFIHSAS